MKIFDRHSPLHGSSYLPMYEGKSMIIYTVAIHLLQFNRNLTLTSFINIVPLFFNAFGPSLHKLPAALRREGFWLSSEPCMHRFFHFFIRGESTPLNAFLSGPNKWSSDGARSGLYGGWAFISNLCFWSISAVCGWALSYNNNTFRQYSSAFVLNCRLQPASKHLTVPRTVYCCDSFLIMF